MLLRPTRSVLLRPLKGVRERATQQSHITAPILLPPSRPVNTIELDVSTLLPRVGWGCPVTVVIGSILLVRGHSQLKSKSFYSLGAHPASLITLCLFTICAGLFAQEPRCSVEIPAIVALSDATLVQRLGSDGFVAHSERGPAKIEGVSSDRGTRRILFVVETGKQIPSTVRKVEAEILTEILKNAR